ncbi:MAG: arylamine N-acetyltransferase [Pseudonocardiaceae bacterium]|nr:arylamine N-acetyltransferase [Pseudonocardiaceae bacterium]
MTATARPQLADEWGIERLDVDAYLDRIGHRGDRAPTVDTLRTLHRAHVTTIPFENLDVLLGRRIGLDVDSLQHKLVQQPRGGYCYEHNLLFAALLERLGFAVRRLSGRVRNGRDTRRPRSHATLWVEADGRPWLADVGFGGERPLEPVRFADGATAAQGGWTYRVDGIGDGEWLLRSLHPDGWFDLYAVDLSAQYPDDFAVQNHYTATHPDSPFVTRIIAQHTAPDVRHTLLGDELRATYPDGSSEQRHVEGGELAEVLRDTFGIGLEPADVAAVGE